MASIAKLKGWGGWTPWLPTGHPVRHSLDAVIASEAKQSIAPHAETWIASRSLSSGAHSRDRLARNDVEVARQKTVIPREGGGSSTPRPIGSSIDVSGILDHPHSRVTTSEYGLAISRHELPGKLSGIFLQRGLDRFLVICPTSGFVAVIPGRCTASSPESISPQNVLPNGFRARDFVAPRNDDGSGITSAWNPAQDLLRCGDCQKEPS
ncbi:hypothetical protein GWE18_18470 [Bradyrhizobium sp. CSA112]|uniref:hypothetical protein n=1 Tax=Bradyrhizobium sp. CSA112 TaxID=2699170 RepID=UPI0023AE6C5E|nr:hypothetical protein [Bradyrhizobium sp. CSA112]MDE5454792.1 hypothetical protein [Bradyrhizobium sp. CSA112]